MLADEESSQEEEKDGQDELDQKELAAEGEQDQEEAPMEESVNLVPLSKEEASELHDELVILTSIYAPTIMLKIKVTLFALHVPSSPSLPYLHPPPPQDQDQDQEERQPKA